jgi:hypothetical protein
MPNVGGGNDNSGVVREMLQAAALAPLGDWFEFVIGPPTMDLDAAPYGGARYPVEARMDTRVFARFHLDVGIGDVVLPPLDELTGRNWLEFAGIECLRVKSISKEQQFAEKLHAYTLPRKTANSRVKDLVDMAMLIHGEKLATAITADAIRVTFERRNTHPIPVNLSPPPAIWKAQFAVLAEECGISPDIDRTFQTLQAFIQGLKNQP